MPEERTDAQSFKGSPLTLVGPILESGTPAPDFKLVKDDLSDATLATYAGKVKILTVFPSLDTPVCDTAMRRFNEEAAGLGVSRPQSAAVRTYPRPVPPSSS